MWVKTANPARPRDRRLPLGQLLDVLAQKLFQNFERPLVEHLLELLGCDGGCYFVCVVHLGLLMVRGRHMAALP